VVGHGHKKPVVLDFAKCHSAYGLGHIKRYIRKWYSGRNASHLRVF
jgi:hypothetical protein